VSKIYKWSVYGLFGDNVQTVNTLHYVTQVPEFWSEPNADDLLTGISDHIADAYAAANSSAWHATRQDLTEILPPGDLSLPAGATRAFGSSGSLTGGNASIPEAITCIISLRTGVPRRWARGYMAMPSPLNQTYIDSSGNFSSAYTTAVNTFAQLLNDELTFGSVNPTVLKPIIYSRTQAALASPQPWAEIKTCVVQSKPKWRRSRLSAP